MDDSAVEYDYEEEEEEDDQPDGQHWGQSARARKRFTDSRRAFVLEVHREGVCLLYNILS